MSSPSSPNLDEVVENIVEEVLKKIAEQPENQEIIPAEEVREETEEVEIEAGEVRSFLSGKGMEAFKKSLAKKGFIEK